MKMYDTLSVGDTLDTWHNTKGLLEDWQKGYVHHAMLVPLSTF